MKLGRKKKKLERPNWAQRLPGVCVRLLCVCISAFTHPYICTHMCALMCAHMCTYHSPDSVRICMPPWQMCGGVHVLDTVCKGELRKNTRQQMCGLQFTCSSLCVQCMYSTFTSVHELRFHIHIRGKADVSGFLPISWANPAIQPALIYYWPSLRSLFWVY